MIKVISDKNSLLEIESEWNSLFINDNNATPFQEYHYILSSLRFIPKTYSLRIIIIKMGPSDETVAIFPCMLSKDGVLQFINSVHSDFVQPLIKSSMEDFNVYEEFALWIQNSKEIKRLNFMNMQSSIALIATIKPFFRYSLLYDCNYWSTIDINRLNGDQDCMTAVRSIQANKRRKYRKELKGLADSISFKYLSKNSEDKYPKKELELLVSNMISRKIRTNDYFSPEMLAFWEELYNHNILHLAIVYQDNEPLASLLVLYDERKKDYITWILLHVDESWNRKITLLLIKHIYENGGGRINFARGIYEYKIMNYHPDVKPLFSVKIAKTRWGHIKNMAAVAFHYSKPIIKSFLGR